MSRTSQPWDLENWKKEQSIKSQEKIDAFVEKHKFNRIEFSEQGKKLLLISGTEGTGVEQAEINSWVSRHLEESGKIFNNCIDIARRMVADGICSGILRSDAGFSIEGTTDLTGYWNHGVGYKMLTDNTVVAVDLTASHNIDQRLGNVDVLVIRAKSLEELIKLLNELFGGNWGTDQQRKAWRNR